MTHCCGGCGVIVDDDVDFVGDIVIVTGYGVVVVV